MRRFIGVLFSLMLIACQTNGGNGSVEKTDTVYITQIDTVPVITGNHLLPKSRKTSISCEVMAIWLDSVSIEPCQAIGPPTHESDGWNFVQDNEGYFHIEVNDHVVCGSDFLFEIELIQGNNLNLLYYPYNSRADCYCCYSFNYYFKDNRKEFENEDWFYEIKTISINGNYKGPYLHEK